jgi:surface antigen
MNKYKKLVFAFFVSAAIMSSKNMLYCNVQAAGLTPDPKSSAYTSDSNIFTKYGYKGQCTWFTYGRAIEKLGISLPSEFYGNAVDWWYANSKDNVYAHGSEPKPNSIAVWGGGNYGYGHVAFVENVSGNTVYFNEGNFNIRGSYDGELKSLSEVAIKDRGNLHLKGYIYLYEKIHQTESNKNQNKTPSNSNSGSDNSSESSIKKGIVSLSSKDSTLNVRSSNNLSSNVIGVLKNGDSVSIIGTYGDWYKINFNSSYGYINSKYITTSVLNSLTNTSSIKNNILTLSDNLTSSNLETLLMDKL